MDKSLKEIMRTKWMYLNGEELTYYSLGIFIECICLSVIISILLKLLFKSDFMLSMVGFTIVSIMFTILIYKRDFFDEKFQLFSDDLMQGTNQGMILFLFISSFLVSWAYFCAALKYGLYNAIAFSLAVCFPGIFMLLRINLYSNKNNNSVYDDNMGFHPIFHWVMGITVASGPLGISLTSFLKNMFVKGSFLNMDLILVMLALLLECFVLSSDVANKILPFELKGIEGIRKFILISFCLMSILLVFNMII
ncbi:hypothetical protein [uncultured Methanobrevibacter sp.]|uniref:hypothetical protein n=1 Tax=uncultured Methanobrevibacter sp. TaxID=253161 RepID=UPI0025D1F6E6|nr:hypothetical protein [uncultured Methanobrevibacter sp.]